MMPKITNSKPEPNPDFELLLKLLNDHKTLIAKQLREATVDPVKLTRLNVMALTQLSAILAVDVHMTSEQFGNICRVQFIEAYNKAPRFS